MKRWLTVFFVLGCSLASFEVRSRADDPIAATDEPAPSPEQIRQWIATLGSDKFDVREAATKRLEQSGIGAVALLSEAVDGTSLEVTGRAIRALHQIAERGDLATFEAAQTILERLAESKNRSASRRASVALYELAGVRRNHTLARIIELGGIVKPSKVTKPAVLADDDELDASQVILNRRWKGGDEGLVYLRRLDELRRLYVVAGANVSPEGLDTLRQSGLEIIHRGEAMLGITYSSIQEADCMVDMVSPGSAADKAGLRKGDIIFKYDGEVISNLSRLVEITNRHKAGDKVEIEIIRGGRPIRKEAVLGEWQ